MYIVIAGGGLFGQGLAGRLIEARHDVVVIERDRLVCEQISSKVGALAINGSATSIETLEDAGVGKAEVAVGALRNDAGNLAFAVLARSFEVPRVIVRMRSSQYESAYKLAGVFRAHNVSDMFIRQVALEIEQPSIHQVATFEDGKASIVVLKIPEGASVDGKTVEKIAADKGFPNECVLAGILKGEQEDFHIPRGPTQINSGDKVFLVADIENVRKAAEFLQRTR